MPYYRRVGEVPRKRHMRFEPGGRYCAEELMSAVGFSAESALLYHRGSPSAVRAVEPVDDPTGRVLQPNEPLRPHHLRVRDVPTGGDLVLGRRALLGNHDVLLSWAGAGAGEASTLYRNGQGDEIVYLQSGAARLESVFGVLAATAGDYVVIPASTTHRWVVEEPVEALVIEARGHVRPPDRYTTKSGQFLEGAPYSERDIRGPDGPLLVDGEDVPVLVRTRSGLTRHVHATHPFDVVGWDGALYPWAFSIQDFEPIVGRMHQPPPVHQTFAGPNFVLCSFVPRLYDFDPQAVKIPYHHANVDSDEVLFYSAGDFMSRAGAGIAVGSMTLHPAGFVHGPQPGSLERSEGQDRTEELAVMVDTFAPLALADAALAVSDPAYVTSWLS